MNARKTAMRSEVEEMLVDVAKAINAAADVGDFPALHRLIERREALNKILDATTTDD